MDNFFVIFFQVLVFVDFSTFFQKKLSTFFLKNTYVDIVDIVDNFFSFFSYPQYPQYPQFFYPHFLHCIFLSTLLLSTKMWILWILWITSFLIIENFAILVYDNTKYAHTHWYV